MRYGKLETQCGALCKILLGNLFAIHVAAPLKCTTYLSIVAQQPFMEKIYLAVPSFISKMPQSKKKVEEKFEEHNNRF